MSYCNQDDAVDEYSTELEMCLNYWQTLSVHVAMNVSAVGPIAEDYLERSTLGSTKHTQTQNTDTQMGMQHYQEYQELWTALLRYYDLWSEVPMHTGMLTIQFPPCKAEFRHYQGHDSN